MQPPQVRGRGNVVPAADQDTELNPWPDEGSFDTHLEAFAEVFQDPMKINATAVTSMVATELTKYTTKTSVQSFGMVLVLQADKDAGRLTILQISDNFAEFGYSPAELIGRDARELLVGAEDIKALRRSILLCRKNRQSDQPMSDKQAWESILKAEAFDGILQVSSAGSDDGSNGSGGRADDGGSSGEPNGKRAISDASPAFYEYVDQLYSKWEHAILKLGYGNKEAAAKAAAAAAAAFEAGPSAGEGLPPLCTLDAAVAASIVFGRAAAAEVKEGVRLSATTALTNREDVFVVTLERLQRCADRVEFVQALIEVMRRMRDARTERELLSHFVEACHKRSRADRAMAYRFAPDFHGEVVAERRVPKLPSSWFGLHFPASDIPVFARLLFMRMPFRMIVDVSSSMARMVPEHVSKQPCMGVQRRGPGSRATTTGVELTGSSNGNGIGPAGHRLRSTTVTPSTIGSKPATAAEAAAVVAPENGSGYSGAGAGSGGPSPLEDGRVDMSECMARCAGGCHLQYLTNMGVQGSMSMAIMVNKNLWGLLCLHHHGAAYYPSTDTRYLLALLCVMAGIQLEKLQREREMQRKIAVHRALSLRLVTGSTRSFFRDAAADVIKLLHVSTIVVFFPGGEPGGETDGNGSAATPGAPAVEGVTTAAPGSAGTATGPGGQAVGGSKTGGSGGGGGGSGGGGSGGGGSGGGGSGGDGSTSGVTELCIVLGRPVRAEDVERIVHMISIQERGEVFHTDRLQRWVFQPRLLKQGDGYELAGAAVLACQYFKAVFLRPEFVHTISWAGRDEDPPPGALMGAIMTPRGSFMRYREEKRGQSLPWREEDLDFLRALRGKLLACEMWRRLDEQQRQTNLELRMARDVALRLAEQKSSFLAHMSHELRTPFNGMIGMLSLLLQTELSPSQKEYAATAYDCAAGMLDILDDVLLVSKLEKQKVTLRIVEFDLLSLVAKVHKLMMVRANQVEVKMSLKAQMAIDNGPFQPMTTLPVQCDPGRIRQVMLNLVGNAIKFVPKKGSVNVSLLRISDPTTLVQILEEVSMSYTACSVAREDLPAVVDGLQVRGELDEDSTSTGAAAAAKGAERASMATCFLKLAVRDNGTGIEGGQLHLLFNPFTQLDNGPGRRYEGTGLGLIICKELVGLMGGALLAFSSKGKGSCFMVLLRLPLASSTGDGTAPPALHDADYKTRTFEALELGASSAHGRSSGGGANASGNGNASGSHPYVGDMGAARSSQPMSSRSQRAPEQYNGGGGLGNTWGDSGGGNGVGSPGDVYGGRILSPTALTRHRESPMPESPVQAGFGAPSYRMDRSQGGLGVGGAGGQVVPSRPPGSPTSAVLGSGRGPARRMVNAGGFGGSGDRGDTAYPREEVYRGGVSGPAAVAPAIWPVPTAVDGQQRSEDNTAPADSNSAGTSSSLVRWQASHPPAAAHPGSIGNSWDSRSGADGVSSWDNRGGGAAGYGGPISPYGSYGGPGREERGHGYSESGMAMAVQRPISLSAPAASQQLRWQLGRPELPPDSPQQQQQQRQWHQQAPPQQWQEQPPPQHQQQQFTQQGAWQSYNNSQRGYGGTSQDGGTGPAPYSSSRGAPVPAYRDSGGGTGYGSTPGSGGARGANFSSGGVSSGARGWGTAASTPVSGGVVGVTANRSGSGGRLAAPFNSEDAKAARAAVVAAGGTLPVILIADDNRVNQLVLKSMIEHMADVYEIVMAKNGVEAQEKALQLHSNLMAVFMDLHMPEMDGFQSCRRIREWEAKTGACPTAIVALTADVMEEAQQRCFASGMDSYLTKPIEFNRLGEVMAHLRVEWRRQHGQ